MAQRLALVKSRDEAFQIGLQTELLEPSQKQASKYDSFILSEPGVPAEKIAGEVLENVKVLFHRYTSTQGIYKFIKRCKILNFIKVLLIMVITLPMEKILLKWPNNFVFS